jgi:hypothetical protein
LSPTGRTGDGARLAPVITAGPSWTRPRYARRDRKVSEDATITLRSKKYADG